MTFRRFVRLVNFVLFGKRVGRPRLTFARTTTSPRPSKTAPGFPPIVQRFDTIGTSDAPNFGAAEAPAASPQTGHFVDAGARFAAKPINPHRRSGRR